MKKVTFKGKIRTKKTKIEKVKPEINIIKKIIKLKKLRAKH